MLFGLTTGERCNPWPGGGARVACLTFSANGRGLLAGLEGGTVRAWSATDGRPRRVFDTGHRHVSKVTLTADLSLPATGGDDCVKVRECTLPGFQVKAIDEGQG